MVFSSVCLFSLLDTVLLASNINYYLIGQDVLSSSHTFLSSDQELTISPRNLVTFSAEMAFEGQRLGAIRVHCFWVIVSRSFEKVLKNLYYVVLNNFTRICFHIHSSAVFLGAMFLFNISNIYINMYI